MLAITLFHIINYIILYYKSYYTALKLESLLFCLSFAPKLPVKNMANHSSVKCTQCVT